MMNEDKELLDEGTFKAVMEIFSEDQNATTDAVAVLSARLEELKKALVDRNKPALRDTQKETLQRLEAKISSVEQAISLIKSPQRFVVQLFPEQDRKLFYKIVFGRWLLYLLIMVAIHRTYLWAIDWNEKQPVVKIQTLKNERIYRAWQQVYDNADRKTKRMMDTTLYKIDH